MCSSDLLNDYIHLLEKYESYDNIVDDLIPAIEETITDNGQHGDTKYSDYKTPGGTNYREFLITMPEKIVTIKDNSINPKKQRVEIKIDNDLSDDNNKYITLFVDGRDYGGEWIYAKNTTKEQLFGARIRMENIKLHRKASAEEIGRASCRERV